jgi:hypothetical protein
MALVLVRDLTVFVTSLCASDDLITFNYQVTGASGFIGSHVVDELLKQGYSVRGYAYVLSPHSTLTHDCFQCGAEPQCPTHKQELRVVWQ